MLSVKQALDLKIKAYKRQATAKAELAHSVQRLRDVRNEAHAGHCSNRVYQIYKAQTKQVRKQKESALEYANGLVAYTIRQHKGAMNNAK